MQWITVLQDKAILMMSEEEKTKALGVKRSSLTRSHPSGSLQGGTIYSKSSREPWRCKRRQEEATGQNSGRQRGRLKSASIEARPGC